jgi:hypothetical protein
MEFSAWSWASHFRLHEAACLIAGVVPISKRNPTTEELPPQARPPLIKLAGAYYEWFLQAKNPERPKSIALEGIPNEDGSLPPFPTLKEVSGEIVSRDAIHRFVSLIAERGFKSCYDFGPIAKAGPPHEVGHQNQAATPAPVMASATPASVETVEQRRDRYLAWHREEERINPRGAVQRVYERELLQNPKADRANIGKDIRKARGNTEKQKKANNWTSQLVTDGKRSN